MKKKLAVFFPGRRYGVDCPLLYYAESICREKGYDTLLMHYSEYRDKKDMITIEENIRQTLSYVRGRIKEKDLASYDEILFVSKSLGTAHLLLLPVLPQMLQKARKLPAEQLTKPQILLSKVFSFSYFLLFSSLIVTLFFNIC